MAKSSVSDPDAASIAVTGSFTATGTSSWISSSTDSLLTVALWGTFVGTVAVEMSFDGGTTAIALSRDAIGTATSFTAPAVVAITSDEPGACIGSIVRLSRAARLTTECRSNAGSEPCPEFGKQRRIKSHVDEWREYSAKLRDRFHHESVA